jgi:hypothetical protein
LSERAVEFSEPLADGLVVALGEFEMSRRDLQSGADRFEQPVNVGVPDYPKLVPSSRGLLTLFAGGKSRRPS